MLLAISEIVATHCKGARTFCDLLAGTTNVGRFFRRSGMEVTSNDANRFSFVLGATYLGLREPPTFSGLTLPTPPASAVELIWKHYDASIRRDGNVLFDSTTKDDVWRRCRRAINVLAYLNENGGGSRASSGRVQRHFTSAGTRARFRSVRGSTGGRNYFSVENAHKLDWILDRVRDWTREGRITASETFFLLCAVIEEVVIVANVSGTFHDFNRDRLWPNALQPLTLRLPLAGYDGPMGHAYCDDALELAPVLPRQDVVYMDPPYNFRQYSAYYHILNLLAAWPFLDDLDGYLAGLMFVRGQNMSDDFTSPLCFRDDFISALRRIIEVMNSKWVVLSYFGGRNHWNHWSRCETPSDDGAQLLTNLFEDRSLFSSSACVPVLGTRLNYQSRVGERKRLVNEHLFVGRCLSNARSQSHSSSRMSALNAEFGLHQFAHFQLR